MFQLNREVDTLLKVVDLACFCLSFLNHHGDDYVDGKEVLLQYQHNYICLSGIEQLLENVNERELFILVRQRSDSWFSIRKKALVTGRTMTEDKIIGMVKTSGDNIANRTQITDQLMRHKQAISQSIDRNNDKLQIYRYKYHISNLNFINFFDIH